MILGDRKLVRSTNAPAAAYRIAEGVEVLDPTILTDESFMKHTEEILIDRTRRLYRGPDDSETDDAVLERLRSLGYIK